MDDAIYEKLACKLGNWPYKFIRTSSNAELDILKAIFTPEEAETASLLSSYYQYTPTIAAQNKIDSEILNAKFMALAEKKLVRIEKRKWGMSFYLVPIEEILSLDKYKDLKIRMDQIIEENPNVEWTTESIEIRCYMSAQEIEKQIDYIVEFLRKYAPGVQYAYGFDCNFDPNNMYVPYDIPLGELKSKILELQKQKIIQIGENDFFIYASDNSFHFYFYHEGGVCFVSDNRDYLSEVSQHWEGLGYKIYTVKG